MTRQDVENIINQNIKDNTTRDVTPAKVREALDAILDWTEENSGKGGSVEVVTTNSNYEYTIPADKLLEKIVVTASADLEGFAVGSTEGQSDLFPSMPVAAEAATIFELNLYATAERSIWFNGITSQTTIKIYLR